MSTLLHGNVCETLKGQLLLTTFDDSAGVRILAYPSISTSTICSCSNTLTSLQIVAAGPILSLID